MKNNKILVSIIVPVYNVEQYIGKCLESLISQKLKEIEIIVVNDGTKDNSQKIIDEYKKKDYRIKSYIKKNGGLSSARNYGLKFAKGEYIGFVDGDDYVDEEMFMGMYSYATSNKLDIVVCDTINVYENGMSYRVSNLGYSDNVVKNYIISPPMACIRIFKKELFISNHFEEGILYEDLNLIPSLVKNTQNVGFINKGYYYYLQRNNSIMKQLTFNEKFLDIFKVLNNNYEMLYDIYPSEVEFLYITHLLRTATLRFLDFDLKESKNYLNLINTEMKNKFPKWRKNIYYKKSSLKLKIICMLAYKKYYLLLKNIKNFEKK